MSKQPIVVKVSRRFEVSPERVFEALLDPQKARLFMFATPQGQMVRAEIDPRVGGKYVFVDRRGGEDVEHRGEYLEIDRPRRLKFSLWVEKHSQSADRITIEVVPRQQGSQVTLSHEMSSEAGEMKKRTEDGWREILEGLEKVL
jgi:uncharacterized protein YndB with AHSA1/START domain